MNLRASTYEEAKARFKPLKGSRMRRSKPLQKAKKAKRPRRISDKQLKKKVWREFSIFIRTRGADEDGFNLCFTCGVKSLWTELHAGHFLRGRLNANLFDERGCHAQCHRCNIHFQGNVAIYYKNMQLAYGQHVIDELMEQNNKTHKWEGGELATKLEYYRNLNSRNPLVQQNGDSE